MKKLILLLSILGSLYSYADIYTVRIDASVHNIPAAFNLTSSSLVLQNARNARSVFVDNRTTSSEVAVNCSGSPTIIPSDAGINNIYVAGGEAWAIDSGYISGNCFIRSMTGDAIESGIIVITIVGG